MSGADINSLQEPTRLILAAIPRGKCYNYPSYSDKLSGSLGSHSWDRQRWDGDPGSLTLPPAGLPAMPTHLVQVANWFVQKPHVTQSEGPGGRGERVPKELRSDEVVPRSRQSLKEEQATPMWRASSSGQPGHFLQCRGEPHTRPPPSPQSLALLWEGAILRARSWIMSHSGCYGPLPGLGHHILANAAGPSKNFITASKNHMETEKEHFIISKYQRFQTLPDIQPGRTVKSLPLPPCPQSPVSHSFCEASGQATGSQKPARG